MTCQLSIFIAAACTIVSAPSAPLDPELVPKDAKWILHVDYEAFSESALAERVRSRRPEIVEHVRTWFEDNCGVDPQKDIKSITLFSESYKTHSGAAVFCGNYDEPKMQALLEKKRDVVKTEADGRTYFTWKMPHVSLGRCHMGMAVSIPSKKWNISKLGIPATILQMTPLSSSTTQTIKLR